MKRKKAVIAILACALTAGYTLSGGVGAFQTGSVNAQETEADSSRRTADEEVQELSLIHI